MGSVTKLPAPCELRNKLNAILALVESDGHAATFQSVDQYRQSLIAFLKEGARCSACLEKDKQIEILTNMLGLAEALQRKQRKAA